MSAKREFSDPTQFQIESLTIDGNDMTGMFLNISIYENIYIPCVTGEIMLLETDGGEFMEKKEIEFTEDIECAFTNALDERLEFKGKLNGVKNEQTKDSKRVYIIEFASPMVTKNESTFITKRFKEETPQDIVNTMLDEKLGAEKITLFAKGEPMNFVGSRRKPFDIIKYVCTHGVTSESKATDNKQAYDETTKGTTGFLCWETTEGYRFATVDQLKKGEAGFEHKGYKKQLAQRNVGMEQAMKGVIDVTYPKMGNMQDKQRAGAFCHKTVLFDMDKGYYKEYTYEADKKTATDKQREANRVPTRILTKTVSNERHNLECEPAQADKGDASRRYLGQNVVRQNTFDDQFGEFTLPPSFKIHAGDFIEFKISKVKSDDKEGGYDEKHSGRYIIKGVAHHLYNNGTSYTRLSTIRTTTQQDDSTSNK